MSKLNKFIYAVLLGVLITQSYIIYDEYQKIQILKGAIVEIINLADQALYQQALQYQQACKGMESQFNS